MVSNAWRLSRDYGRTVCLSILDKNVWQNFYYICKIVHIPRRNLLSLAWSCKVGDYCYVIIMEVFVVDTATFCVGAICFLWVPTVSAAWYRYIRRIGGWIDYWCIDSEIRSYKLHSNWWSFVRCCLVAWFLVQRVACMTRLCPCLSIHCDVKLEVLTVLCWINSEKGCCSERIVAARESMPLYGVKGLPNVLGTQSDFRFHRFIFSHFKHYWRYFLF